MLRYHAAFHLPRTSGEMAIAEALDFPGAVTQGFDLADARLMIASAMEDLAQCLLEDGRLLPAPNPDATADADLIELVPLSVHVGRPELERGCTDRSSEAPRLPVESRRRTPPDIH
jgi:predicted RNase H-like HicB family nuclease